MRGNRLVCTERKKLHYDKKFQHNLVPDTFVPRH